MSDELKVGTIYTTCVVGGKEYRLTAVGIKFALLCSLTGDCEVVESISDLIDEENFKKKVEKKKLYAYTTGGGTIFYRELANGQHERKSEYDMEFQNENGKNKNNDRT